MTQDPGRLRDVLARARQVLLDFDGPVCSVFAGLPATQIAAELHALVDRVEDGEVIDDPHQVLIHAAVTGADTAAVEDALRSAEIRAARSATPTPGAADFLTACQRTGRPVTIVSNNSADAIAAYFEREDLTHLVARIVGRDPADPRLMKPNPHLIRLALDGKPPHEAVLIGDSTTDIAAAHAAGVPAIGYANKPGKTARLQAAGADALVTAMHELALTAEQPTGATTS